MGEGSSFKANVRSAILALQTTVVVAIFSFSIFFLDFLFGNYSSAIGDVCLVIVAIACFNLIWKGKINAGKLILVFITLFIITFNASKEGPQAGNQFLWFTCLIGIFALFSLKEKGLFILCLVSLFGTLIFCDITDFSLRFSENLGSDWEKLNFTVVMYCSLAVCLFFLVSISKSMAQSLKDKDRNSDIKTRQKSTLQNANYELDKFVYHAAHDLRAPLTSMLGLIEVSKNEPDINKLRVLLNKQEQTINILDNYVKDILLLSRVKRTALDNSINDIANVVQGVLNQCQFMLDEKNVKVNLNLSLPPEFICDHSRLHIILSNILSNSIKYTDDTKEENIIDIEGTVENQILKISITDNGVGIDKEELNKVTEMFYYNKSQNKGTGLGLYIVKEAITKIGGTLSINSVLGEYATVSITIPQGKLT
jgi:signal transduction histidine kinase